MAGIELKKMSYKDPVTGEEKSFYPETDAAVVKTSDGSTVQAHINNTAIHLTQAKLDAAIDAVKNGDLKTVQDNLSTLQTAVNAFLNGDADGGTMDRLVELVAAINANKDSIDALVSDKVAKTDIVNDLTSGGTGKVLSAEQGKALKTLIDAIDAHSHTNKAILDGLGKDASGNLQFNGKTLDGQVDVAVLNASGEIPATLRSGGLIIRAIE